MNEQPGLSDREDLEAMETLRSLAGAMPAVTPPAVERQAPLPPPTASLPAWSEQNFRDLIEGLPDAIVVIDAAGAIALVNHQTERLFGYARDELLGEVIEILVPERYRATHFLDRDGYLAAPRTRPLGVGKELFGRRKDGSEVPVEISLSPLRTASGLLVTAVVRDLSERKRSEAKFRTLVENIPAVTFIAPLDESEPELYVSPQIEALLGFSQKEWLEDPVLWHRQLHPEDRDRWNLQFAPTCSRGEPFRATYRFIAKDGRTVWVHGSANMVRDEDDQLLFLQGVAFDITAIKAAEEERERFFALSLDLFGIADLDGLFKRVNQAFTTVLGYGADELQGRPLLDLVHPADRAMTEAVLAGLARGEPSERFENRCRCRDGSYRWLQWTAAPFVEGRLCYLAARDVTREKKDEEALHEQARLALLRAEVSAATTGTDSLAGMLQRCVTALTRGLAGSSACAWTSAEENGALKPTATAGQSCPVSQGEVERVAVGRQPLCLGSKTATLAGYPLLIEDRLLGVLAVSSQPPLSPAALQTLELVAAQIALAIKRKQAEDELVRANADLDQRVRQRTVELSRSLAELQDRTEEMRKYAHHATHDIKEPLRNINIQTQRVAGTFANQLPAEAIDRLGKVKGQIKRMEVLLERLKEYAKVYLSSSPQPVDCNAAVAVAVNTLEAAIDEGDAEVMVGELPTVIGDQQHLELLFQNLIGNALKYRSPVRPPRVEVGARREGDGWLFWVKDNGVGIEPRFWEKIFGLGERLDAKTSGWGYGLAICEKSVSRHGGRIWVTSEPGQGSTFFFTLPERPPLSRSAELF
jgi:PAS domain S-box-containing protein